MPQKMGFLNLNWRIPKSEYKLSKQVQNKPIANNKNTNKCLRMSPYWWRLRRRQTSFFLQSFNLRPQPLKLLTSAGNKPMGQK